MCIAHRIALKVFQQFRHIEKYSPLLPYRFLFKTYDFNDLNPDPTWIFEYSNKMKISNSHL